ncbi:MAG: adenosylmethionine decarboxylase [Gammaproteobacteria bacterium]|nr:adenosylmethionine decarboxylase [Gammaproteobacteria bacterium]
MAAPEVGPSGKLRLHGFNNLTKTLSFNFYDICYAKTLAHRAEYIAYIDEEYNADRLTNSLTQVAQIIGASVLNIARQDYEPQGASVTMLIAEEPVKVPIGEDLQPEAPGPLPESVVAHLDKSHMTVHTYPESHPSGDISTFRADIDVSTCGEISPLRALNYLIHEFESDIVTVDYRVRGFTRDVDGCKYFLDHEINSIQNFMSDDVSDEFQMMDMNDYQNNTFHTRMTLKNFDLDNYLFGTGVEDLEEEEAERIRARIETEMEEIFYGRNVADD